MAQLSTARGLTPADAADRARALLAAAGDRRRPERPAAAAPARALAPVPGTAAEASAALWAAYARRLAAAGRSPRTLACYQWSVLRLAAHAGVPLDDITTRHVETFLADERARVAAGGRDGGPTAAGHYRALRAFYTWAENAELIDRSPLRGLPMPKAAGKLVPVPDITVIQQLLDSIETKRPRDKTFDDHRDAAIIRFACELGGPRRAELAAMQLADVDLRRGGALLHGKGGKDRWVPFGGKTTEALMRYLAARKRHPLAASPMLWLGARGKPLTGDGIMQMTRRRAARAGLPHLHPHMFRHFAAAQAKRHRVPAAAARALFGWATSAMYDGVYAAWSDADDAQQLARQLALGDQI